MFHIGVDFGGTKIEAALLTPKGEFLSRLREPNPGDYDKAVALVKDLIARVEAEGREALGGSVPTIGIGSPGSVSPRNGVMRNSNSLYLNGRRFREDLELALGRPVKLANDANCLALSEAIDGAGAGASSVFAIIVGTGCGGGVVINGQLVEGANGVAGEWGHMPLPWMTAAEFPGNTCWCGLKGCLETYISGTGFALDFEQATGRKLKGEEIVTAMRAGDEAAAASFERLMSRLGRAMAMIVNALDPDVFVFGGGLSNVAEIYQALPGHISPYVFSDAWEAKLVPAKWGDSSGVRGAAYLWAQK